MAEIKAFVVDTYTPYIRTKPIHLRRRIPPSSPLPPFTHARGGRQGFVLEQKSDKYAAICRRMEAKCTTLDPFHLPRRSNFQGPSILTHPFPFLILTRSLLDFRLLFPIPRFLLSRAGEERGGEQTVTLKLLRPNKM